jgi:hypothetical protein
MFCTYSPNIVAIKIIPLATPFLLLAVTLVVHVYSFVHVGLIIDALICMHIATLNNVSVFNSFNVFTMDVFKNYIPSGCVEDE